MSQPVHVQQLLQALGAEQVKTGLEDRALYGFDATADTPAAHPEVVVTPADTAQVQAVLRICSEHRLPVTVRGAGTNLSGGTIPLQGGVVMSMQRMNRILEVDAENLTATVEPGVVIQALNEAVAPFGLIYPPDPGTVATATMGGSTAECSGGLRGLKYGVTKHYVLGLEVVLADGEVFSCGGKTVKNVSGYDLVKLFTGSEGTLGVITKIIVKLIPAPQARRSMLAVFDDLDAAGRAIAGVIAAKVIPATMEIIDRVTCEAVEAYAHVGLPTDAEAVLLLEVDGVPAAVEEEARAVEAVCRQLGGRVRLARDDAERDQLWAARRACLPALARKRPTCVLEDATVPRSQVPRMLRALKDIAARHRVQLGTFGHAGDGNLHPTILCDQRDAEEMARVHAAVDDIFETAISLGGTLSGEHGVGSAKKKYLELEFGPTGVEVLRRIKHALDPQGLLNPGKVVDARA